MNDRTSAPAGERDPHDELADIAASARAWLQWMADCGAESVPTGMAPERLLRRLDAAELPRDARAGAPPRGSRPSAHRAPARVAPPARPAAPPRDPAPAPSPPAPPPPAVAARGTEPVPLEERRRRLAVLAEEVAGCTKCPLHASRTQTVFERGSPAAELCFVGEGPGADEDRLGKPFVGKAGQLLDKMVVAMGYGRDDVYVCNVVKCRPPDNRKPTDEEMAACLPYLRAQLELVDPKCIVALGATGVQGMLGTSMGITRLRGTWKLYEGRTPVMPTFHPAYLLRSPEHKRHVWEDLQQVMRQLGKQPPPKKKPR